VRRALLIALLAALASCRGRLPSDPLMPAGPPVSDPPRRPGRPLLFIAMPDSPPFRVVRQSMVEELQEDFDIATLLVGPGIDLARFAEPIGNLQPRAVVVMDNPVLALYRGFAERASPERPAPPAVVVMTSFLEELRNMPSTTGIAYEVPGVTAFVQLRSVISQPVRRVAVLYRPRFRRFIERQSQLAAKEQITLVPLEVADTATAGDVRAVLRQAREVSQMDALWVLNDNGLLRDAQFLSNAWRPEIGTLRVPVVVGLSSLVESEAQFGTFAVVPDHEALGVQSAQLIFKLADAGWPRRHPIEPPFSTVTIANLPRLEKLFGLRPGAAERVDRVIGEEGAADRAPSPEPSPRGW
jgi:hypothetical protein